MHNKSLRRWCLCALGAVSAAALAGCPRELLLSLAGLHDISFEEVDIVSGPTVGTFRVQVRGEATGLEPPDGCSQVVLAPFLYAERPEFWEIDVLATRPEPLKSCSDQAVAYSEELPLDDILGTSGIAVAGTNGRMRLGIPRLITFESAEIISGQTAGSLQLVVRGKADPCSRLRLSPLKREDQPAYWGIQVFAIPLPDQEDCVAQALAPYTLTLPIDSSMGASGVEVIGAEAATQLLRPQLADFTEAEILPGNTPAGLQLVVRGKVADSCTDVRLLRLEHPSRPEYWGIQVLATRDPAGACAAVQTPYTISVPLDDSLGSLGVQVFGASSNTQLNAPCDFFPETNKPTDFDSAEIVPGASPGTFVLVVRGSAVCTDPGWTLTPQPATASVVVELGGTPRCPCDGVARPYVLSVPLDVDAATTTVLVVGRTSSQSLALPPN